MKTEAEARDIWCPFTRVGEQASGATENRPDGSYNCIASGCMAWRWQPLQADQPFMDAVKARMETANETHAKAVKYVRANLAKLGLPSKPFRGYCGAFGKPEA